MLKAADNILVLCHANPDGDTLGSGYALLYALQSMGKSVRLACSDPIPGRFSYMSLAAQAIQSDFEPQFIVACDIAALQLFGENLDIYRDKVDLCIDHHLSNAGYAKHTLLNSEAAATCELLYDLCLELCIEITPQIADCLYTGLATDTGCFKFSNTTPRTHRYAALLMEAGADYEKINRLMFETKTKKLICFEPKVMSTMEFHHGDRMAMITITTEMMEQSGIDASMLDMFAAMPRQVEGVEIGVTLKQRDEDHYKVSVRTNEPIDASKLCAVFGGGGHVRAGGCLLEGDLDSVRKRMIDAAGDALENAQQE